MSSSLPCGYLALALFTGQHEAKQTWSDDGAENLADPESMKILFAGTYLIFI